MSCYVFFGCLVSWLFVRLCMLGAGSGDGDGGDWEC